MPRGRSTLGRRGRVIGNQTAEGRDQRTSETDNEWLEYMPRKQQSEARLEDVRLRALLEIGSRMVPVDLTSGQILLPRNFCNLVTSKELF
ncbi:hypothetical protein LOAG_19268 [Loa loa]|uniref:Reverse transcriptase domain-containing protein n=2 Tax=Loa loa TaxID=7209 RepID=A0A1I7V8W8_LOALO|nr:hypothetical protein LOAG_19268 [Loa loa]EJD73310.1 hypothetical protein LOAG_19268 [Loa loa]